MATSSSDCGDNGYCIWEWNSIPAEWNLIKNQAKAGFACIDPPSNPGSVEGELKLTCAEPSSS